MQIKRFRASDMNSALKMIKQEFGPEAVILSVRDMEKGKGIFGMMGRGGLEVTAAIDAPFSDPQPRPEPEARLPFSIERPPVSVTLSSPRRRRPAAPAPRPAPEVPEAPAPAPLPPAPPFPEFYRRLVDQDVLEEVAREIVAAIDGMPNDALPLPERLSRGLARFLQDKGVRSLDLEPEPGKQRLVAFLGPAGVGKTTTIAKLSGHHALRGREIGIIALEDDRICALRKMEIFAKIINVPMEVAGDGDGLQRAIRRFRSKEIVYVDTPGIGFGDTRALEGLREKLKALPEIRNQLLISAGAREREMAALVRGFSAIPLHALILTKLDESPTHGNLLNHLVRSPMPLSYVTSGQQVPEDIRPASPGLLAGLFTGAEAAGSVTAQAPSVPPGAAPETGSTPPAAAKPAAPAGPLQEEDDPFEVLRYYGGRT